MESIQKYYSDIRVEGFESDAESLLKLACIAERNATDILGRIPRRKLALEDEILRFEVYFADELMSIAEKRLDVCMCILDRGCDGTCTSCVKAFEEMLRAEDELDILNK